MPPSYRKINYSLRPAKNVERKLIADTLNRLNRLTPVSEMCYVGMGSVYFADFSVFHRRLGFAEMHSIEYSDDLETRKRFEFNRPFDTKLYFTKSTSALPTLPWDKPSVVWLDYDDEFDEYMISDIDIVTRAAELPLVFMVSVNVEPGDSEGRRERLLNRVGDLMPADVKRDADLGGAKMGSVVYEVIDQAIKRALGDRTGVLSGDEMVMYQQLFNFRYADGARMLTVGGLFYRARDTEVVRECKFEALPHVRDDHEFFDITVPHLTVREALHLDAQLPTDLPLEAQGISSSELLRYARLYRYLPSFIDTDL